MRKQPTRREVLRDGLAVAGLGMLGAPAWALPRLAPGEVLVPFTDLKATFPVASADRRIIDIRQIDGPFTPNDQFFTTQHYSQPEVDPWAFRLGVWGLVDRPLALSLDDLRQMGDGTELVAGFECSGNRRPLQGLCGNGRWTGVPLRAVLDRAGVKPDAREFVFLGADHGQEEVEFRTQKYMVDQPFGRSLSREKALSQEPFLAYALNGEPLTRHQGAPLRLLVPGWYGMANVKWLSQIYLQDGRYPGKYQARGWYRTLKGARIGSAMKCSETAVTSMQLKSFVARVARTGNRHHVLVVALNDGTPLKSVDVRVDDGPWQPATMDRSTSGTYSWKLFSYVWTGATPGEHTIVSRATDVNGRIQPTSEELERGKTFLQDNSQFPRKMTIA